jgi:hypothetical protein
LFAQTAFAILMVRPASFGFNTETAADNVFQTNPGDSNTSHVQEAALKEFDDMVALLRQHDIQVIVAEDVPIPPKPDAIFPNNWLRLTHEGDIELFPMLTANRRIERELNVRDLLQKEFLILGMEDWSPFETVHQFLEGTGSMVMDHANRRIYACRSARTDETLLNTYAQAHQYALLCFSAHDEKGIPFYHTNVMMAIGETFAIVCTAAITNKDEREEVVSTLRETGHAIIDISPAQVNAFAGNMLQLRNTRGKPFTIMSRNAYQSLTNDQLTELLFHNPILAPDIDTIETIGGGSVRCMMAEIFLPALQKDA